ncbi:uncharacterized protein P174DRAFT_431375 [Aspergillus novofumigatus IBT 16806]|uniref:Uncharacterized protein n=1 Tax=Aspergillus novofumigatus (strain IBT 16806) TaxID=1392255 RepID=A0A2I1CA06_ASPN1|nr:uncharacterized protein P174DRAFT_431375 [Aspergillus novofumigatus IBT 16806]PKX94454.1 hypothetical protein P174DRAFT_431375 [Aspergillus novofumigatus IBT 16806]
MPLMPSKLKRFKKIGRARSLRRFQMRRSDRDIHLVNGTSATRKALAEVMALQVKDETYDESQGSFSFAPWVPSSATEDIDVVEPQALTSSVKHPWGIIDYHLYLNSLEAGKDMHIRREDLYLFDGTDCEPIRYCDLFITEIYRMEEDSQRARLLFAILPIAEKGAVFGERNYVLGYDWKYRSLFARHFNWMPHDIRDIWSVWSEGTTVYTISISRLFSLLQSTFQKRTGRAGEGILSSNPLCTSLQVSDDPGMEMVIVTMFAQFAADFIDVIFIQEEYQKQKFRHQLAYYEDQCRQTMQRASYRAWFALRAGSPRAKNRTEKNDDDDSFRQLLQDLYDLEEEERQEQEQSHGFLMQGGEWCAADFETWRWHREENRKKRREEAARRLEGLFAVPDDLPEIKSPGQEFENIMIKAGEHPTIDENYPPDAPRTPSPPFRHRSVLQQIQCLSPGSPGIVRPATEDFDDFEATEYHKIPLPLLLRRTLELLEERPDLDSLDNRGRFGSLLTDLRVRVRKRPVDEFTIASSLGYENDSWKLEVQTQPEIEDQPPRCLLPSPLFD